MRQEYVPVQPPSPPSLRWKLQIIPEKQGDKQNVTQFSVTSFDFGGTKLCQGYVLHLVNLLYV